MLSVSELIARKKELRYTNEEIAKLSGVPLSTVRKIFAGITAEPRRATLEALSQTLGARAGFTYDNSSARKATRIQEEAPAFLSHLQGTYTIRDYDALPEESRAELIDGVIYDMGAPSRLHQLILGEVFYQLYRCAEEKRTGYEVIAAPYDVQLHNDIYTMVQPDIVVSKASDIKDNHHFVGAPDFLIEIISPATRSRDLLLKASRYREANVKEYWIVDPKYRKVTVYLYEDEERIVQYDFEAKVPVGISKGKCAVDFSLVAKKVARFYDKKGNLLEEKKDKKQKSK